MGRTLVISDIHGCYDEFNSLLEKAKYMPNQDKLILLGDYVDRGMKSKQVIEKIQFLKKEYGAIVLKGNHDQMFVDAMFSGEDGLWLNNGGYSTIESYCGFEFFEDGFEWDRYELAKKYIIDNYRQDVGFLKSLPLYYETKYHIFVHAGINPFYEDWKNQPDNDFIWIRNMFYNNKNSNTEKTVVFGHTATIELHDSTEIWFSPDGGKIGIDGSCAYGYQLNCLEINEDCYRTYSVEKGDSE